MKKFFILSVILISLPSYSACPIDINDETVCALPGFREQSSPIFQNSNNTNIGTPGVRLQPLTREDPINQMREPNNNLNYNSGCQFGVCLQNPNQSRLPAKSGID